MKPIDLLYASAGQHRHSIINTDGDYLVLGGVCPVTKKSWTLRVRAAGYTAWTSGKNIQDALPEVSSQERELLLSGTSPEGWELLFGGDE